MQIELTRKFQKQRKTKTACTKCQTINRRKVRTTNGLAAHQTGI